MSQRILFIDQLKGLAMLMVVFGHLLQFSFGIPDSPWERILESFDLPLFFFVSGYFCLRKEGIRWLELPGQIVKRIMAYLFPMISVGLLYCVLTDYSLNHLVMSGGGKLWFLYTLFWLAAICLIISAVRSGGIHRNSVVIDVVCYGVPYVIIAALRYSFPDAPGICPWGRMFTYYPYFILGVIVKKNGWLQTVIQTNTYVYTIAIIVFVLGITFSGYSNKVIIFLTAIGAIIMLWHLFSHIEKQNVITKALGVVGRHTLPIYVFHYFFIPDLSVLDNSIMSAGNPFVIHMVACIALCACILPLCIVIEYILDISPILSLIMLGKKKVA